MSGLVAPVLAAVSCGAAGCTGWFTAQVVCAAARARRHMSARKLTLEDVVADRTLCFVVLAAAAGLLASLLALWMLPFLLVVAWVLARKAPGLLQRRKQQQLRSACDGQLDILADVVALGVRAGLSFDAALDVYCAKFDGVLSQQLQTARTAYASGMASREQALQDAAVRVDSKALQRFVETSTQAVRYGSPLAELLVKFSADVRRERHAHVEQQVARAPVKMLIPLGTCILPALLLLVAGPVMLQFLGSGV